MNVYITTLDKESEVEIEIIVDMFSKDRGDIKFIPLMIDSDSTIHEEYNDLNKLHLDDINTIVEKIKLSKEKYNEYVVLITKKSLDIPVPESLYGKDWNSAFIKKNIAVNSSRWSKLTEDRSYLAIAHQIVENIFQCLSHQNLNEKNILKDIHTNTRGCINDYCRNFEQIYAKILGGFICKECQKRALNFIQEKDVIQFRKILTRIRNRITDNYDFEINHNTKIKVDKYGEITLGDTKLDFKNASIVRLSYLFYLINYNKIINSNDLLTDKNVREKFIGLSSFMGLHLSSYAMDMYVNNIRTYQTRTKQYLLNSLINENLVDHFAIKGKSEKFENKPKKKIHFYQIQIENESDIEIEQSLLKYRQN